MKYFNKYLNSVVIGLCIIWILAPSFEKADTYLQTVYDEVSGEPFERIENSNYAGPGAYAQKLFNKDTITNTANDTLAIPITLASPYQYSWHTTLVAISGTRSLKLYLQESNTTETGTADWVSIDSITPTTPINQYARIGSIVGGRRQRILVDGVSGTQSQAYTTTIVYKRRE